MLAMSLVGVMNIVLAILLVSEVLENRVVIYEVKGKCVKLMRRKSI